MKDIAEAYGGKRVLVTGGLGFIGSNLAERLLDCGAEVAVVDALVPGQGGNPFNLQGFEDRLEVCRADIGDAERVEPFVRGRDYIFNLAAYTSHIRSIEMPLEDLDINCRSHLSFLELVKDVNRDCRIVYTGSRCQYGRAVYLPMDEDHPFNVADINGVHKATVEHYHLLYSRIYGLPCVCLRLSNVYGPKHQMSHSKQGFLNWFIRVALEGDEIQVFGDGAQRRDFVYVDDAVEAILQAAAEEACDGRALNIGSGAPVSIGQAAERITAKTGTGFRSVPFPHDYLSIEAGDLYLDISRMREATGWQPRVGFEEGLELTLDFYRDHGKMYWDNGTEETELPRQAQVS
ncbi:MAG: NAD-dependent epimerase/dehydratase family protein [Candidatus Geothermincolia bacterium]